MRDLDPSDTVLWPTAIVDCGVAPGMSNLLAGYGEHLRYQYDLLDRFDEESGVHSMARTTGYAATMALRLLAEGLFSDKGLIVPEFLGRSSTCVEFMLRGLRARGIVYEESIEKLVD